MADGMFSENLKGYRANPKNLYGAKDRMETLPTKLNKAEMYTILSGLSTAEKAGMPKLSDKQLANMFLNEGRSDAGFNNFNFNNKQAKALYDKLIEEGQPALSAGFAAAVLDKTQEAKRLNKDFNELWNGVGTSNQNRTGAQNAQRMQEGQYAPDAPKNEQFMGWLKGARYGTLPKEEQLLSSIPMLEKNQKLFGGLGSYGTKNYLVNTLSKTSPESAAYVDKMSPSAVYNLVMNDYLRKNKIEERQPDYYLHGNGNKQQKFDQLTADQLYFGRPDMREAVGSLTGLPLGSTVERVRDVYEAPQVPWYQNALQKLGF
jgi:hypothetical protein